MSKEFLFDTTLTLAVKVLDAHQLLGDLIKLFYAPARVINIRKIFNGVLLLIEQRGAQNVGCSGNRIFHQAQGYRFAIDSRVFFTWCDLIRLAGDNLYNFVSFTASDKLINGTGGLVL